MNLNPLKSLTLLYVEDEELIRKNAKEYLDRYCYKVYTAKDGEEGYQRYMQYQPDIIISDIKMPKLNGLDFAKKIRQSDKKTPIIIATAHTQTEYLLQAVELQLIKYIVKPITSEKLNEALLMAYHMIEEGMPSHLYLNANTYYDILNKTLFSHDSIIKLTHNEQLLFDLLIDNKQRAITYKEIEGHIWSYEGMSMDALRSLVRGLHKKLAGDYIANISGIGYKIIFQPKLCNEFC